MRTDRSAPGKRQRGFALIAVSVVIAIVTTVVMDFSYTTNVDYAAATNARDEMRAHFLARSVMSLSELLIKVQRDLIDPRRRQLAQFGLPDLQIGDYMSLLEVPVCGKREELAEVAGALGGIDASAIKGLGVELGTCRTETFESEDGKINLTCANGNAATANALAGQLTGLVTPGIYDRIFQERDGDGQFTDRAMFVRALIDYADRDEAAYGTNGQPEDYGYEGLRDPYKAKNNYVDSVDELQLVRGMDDRRWQIFGPELTVYGGCKVNVSATQSPIQTMGLIVQTAKNPDDPVLKDPARLWALAVRVAQARALGLPFDDLDAFVTFVKDPDAALGLGALQAATATDPAAVPPPIEGVELDKAKLAAIARAGSRRTYRIVAASQVGRVEKRIIGVYDTTTRNQNTRDPSAARGTWVYWREE